MRRFLVNSCSQCSRHKLLGSLGREVFSLPYFSSKLHIVVLCIEEVRKNCVPRRMYHRAKVVLIVGERGRSLAMRSLEISMLTNNSDSNHVNNYRYYINDIYTILIQQTNYTERYGISLLLHNCEDRFHIQVFIRSSNI